METSIPDIASIFFLFTYPVCLLLVTSMLFWLYRNEESKGIRGLLVVLPTIMTEKLVGWVRQMVSKPLLKPEPVLIQLRND